MDVRETLYLAGAIVIIIYHRHYRDKPTFHLSKPLLFTCSTIQMKSHYRVNIILFSDNFNTAMLLELYTNSLVLYIAYIGG